MNDPAKTLVLVDGSSYLYRAFHALPPLTNSAGEPTGAALGVTNMLRTLLREHEGAEIVVVFDAPGKTFRETLYEAYKSNRPPMPDDLRAQIPPIHAIVRALGLPCLVVDGVEADDVIGTLARRGAEAGRRVVISTGDKDMAQLVTPQVTLINTMTRQAMDVEGVHERFGVGPHQIADFLALVGDPSDNIPGVPGVGPKTAAALLQEHESLAGVLLAADGIRGRVGERLREHRDQLPLGRTLATIRCDIPLEEAPDLERRAPDPAALRELYRKMEFRRLLRELLAEEEAAAAAGEAPPPAEIACERILTAEALDRLVAALRAAGEFALDAETTSLDTLDARVVGLAFATHAGAAAYVPIGHVGAGAPAQLPRDEVLARIGPLLEDETLGKIGHNLKYDLAVLQQHGIRCRGRIEDTMLQSYVLNSTATRHDLDSLALRYLAHRITTFEEVAGRGAAQKTFDEVGIEEATCYAGEDAEVTLRLHEALRPALASEASLDRVYREIEIPLVPVLSRMESRGVLIDAALLQAQSAELEGRLHALEADVFELAGEEFNLGSPQQVQRILFEKLGLPSSRRTPGGQPSTAESVLQELALDYPVPRLILEHRGLAKLKSTYTDRLPAQVHPRTGRIHTSYHQAVTATGRLSSSNPNLQNIPVRSEFGRRIRQAFIAPEGTRLLAADYSQIELRILAHFSGDEGLVAAFLAGQDIHSATAAEIFDTPPEAVDAEQRRSAKAINFGLIYGMSAFGLARQLGISRSAAQRYMDRYFARYPGVREYMERIRHEAAERGHVETLFGRRLHLPDLRSRNRQRREYAERAAINAPMQGTAADIIKRAMVRIDTWLQASPDLHMIMQVHDELVFEVPADRLDEVRDRIRHEMTSAASLAVPLVVDMGTGANWDEAR